MGKREILVGALLGALALGGATMIEYAPALFPNHAELIFYLGSGCVGVAVVGLAVLFFWPRSAPPTERQGVDQSVSSNNQSGGITAWSVDKDTE